MQAEYNVQRVRPVKLSPPKGGLAGPALNPAGPPVQETDDTNGIRAIGALLVAAPFACLAFFVAIVLGVSFLMSLVIYWVAGFGAFLAVLCWSLLVGTNASGPGGEFRPRPEPRQEPWRPRQNAIPRDWRNQCVARPVTRRKRR